MLEKGYHIEVVNRHFSSTKTEPIWPLAKSHVSKAQELAEDPTESKTSPIKLLERKPTLTNIKKKPPAKDEKLFVVDGVLLRGDIPKGRFWVNPNGELVKVEDPAWKTNTAKLAWKAKLERMKKQKKLEPEEEIEMKMPNVPMIPSNEELIFGETVVTKQLLNDPDVQRALGFVKTPGGSIERKPTFFTSPSMAKMPSQNFITANKKRIKDIENRVAEAAQIYETFQSGDRKAVFDNSTTMLKTHL